MPAKSSMKRYCQAAPVRSYRASIRSETHLPVIACRQVSNLISIRKPLLAIVMTHRVVRCTGKVSRHELGRRHGTRFILGDHVRGRECHDTARWTARPLLRALRTRSLCMARSQRREARDRCLAHRPWPPLDNCDCVDGRDLAARF